MIGHSIGRCTIESKLGEGGMGVVYRARDTQLGRIVAITILPPDPDAWTGVHVSDSGREGLFKIAVTGGPPTRVTINTAAISVECFDGRDLYYVGCVAPS